MLILIMVIIIMSVVAPTFRLGIAVEATCNLATLLSPARSYLWTTCVHIFYLFDALT